MSQAKFQKALIAPTSKILKNVLDQEREVTNNWVTGVLVGRAPRPELRPKPLRRDETFLLSVLQHYGEVDASLSTLEVITKLSRRSPPKNIHVDPGAQLKLFVEAYLGEVYLLRERCETLAAKLIRAYRNHPQAAQITAVLRDAASEVSNAFTPIITARGAHVHERRHQDFEVDRLATLALLAERGEPVFGRIRRAALKGARRTKTQWMSETNGNIKVVLDNFFGVLHKVVFDEHDAPRFPPQPPRRG